MQTLAYIILAAVALFLLFMLILFVISKMKGSIKIQLDNYQFSPGETITGKILLKTKKPLDSKGLYVYLIGEKTNRSTVTIGSNTKNNSRMQNYKFFEFKQPLEGAKKYAPSETSHDFSIKIPRNILSNPQGIAGTLVKSIKILAGDNSMIRWYVKAELNVSGLNISQKVQVNIA